MSTVNYSLDEICLFIKNGKSVKQSKEIEGIPVTRIETIANESIDSNRVGYAGLSEKGNENYLLQKGDILFSHINSVDHLFKTAQYEGFPEKLIHGMNLLCLRPNPELVFPRYFLHLLKSHKVKKSLLLYANKSVNQASISAGNLKSFKVNIPSLEKQHRIASILDKADELRQKRQQAIEKLDQLLQATFIDMFGDPISNPKNWDKCLLEKVTHKITDGTHKTPIYMSSGIEFLSAKDIKKGRIVWNTNKYISEQEHSQLIKRCNPEIGDIVLAKSGSLGSVAIIDRSHQFSLFESLCLIKHDRQKIDAIFLTSMLRSPSMLSHLLGKNKGIAIKHLHLVDIRELEILLPPIELQHEFSSKVRAIDKLISIHLSSFEYIDSLFKSLQNQAFSGTL